MESGVAIVTGGSLGIGQATSRAFARLGFPVAIIARTRHSGIAAVDEIRASGGIAEFFPCDVGKDADVTEAFRAIEERFERIDVLVNNAGGGGPYTEDGAGPYGLSIDELTESQWDFVIDKNLRAAFLCSKAATKHFKAAGNGGVIVNVVSVAGLKAVPYQPAYVAAKHAIVGLTKALALDLGQYGIRVNAVAPGTTNTPALRRAQVAGGSRRSGGVGVARDSPDDLPEEARLRLARRVPLRQVGEPEHIASAVTFLASHEARHITGIVLPVDGGSSAT